MIKEFKKNYTDGFNNYQDAMDAAINDYGPYLCGIDLTFIGAYVRAAWNTPEKLTPEVNKILVKTIKKAKKWAQFRADFRI